MKALQRLERDRGSDKNRSLHDEVLASEATRSQGKAGMVQLLIGTSVGVVFASALVGVWFFVSPVISPEQTTTPAAVAAAPPQTQPQPQTPAMPTVNSAIPPRPAVPASVPRSVPGGLLPAVEPPPVMASAASPERVVPPGPSAPVITSVREEEPRQPALVEETVPEEVPVEVIEVEVLETEVEVVETPVLEVEVEVEAAQRTLQQSEELTSPLPEETTEETVEVVIEEVLEANVPAPKEEVVVIQESVAEEVVVEKGMAFPEFLVKKTVWHPRADQRMAYVSIPKDADPKSVREGDTIENLEVLSIEPAAVILGRDGVEVRKRVGEE